MSHKKDGKPDKKENILVCFPFLTDSGDVILWWIDTHTHKLCVVSLLACAINEAMIVSVFKVKHASTRNLHVQ